MLPRDLELVGLSTQGPLELGDLLFEFALGLALVLAVQGLGAALEQLLAPLVVKGLGDPVLTADVTDRLVAAQAGQHDLDLLLGRELSVVALLAQLVLLPD
jgi:hypothetical protein